MNGQIIRFAETLTSLITLSFIYIFDERLKALLLILFYNFLFFRHSVMHKNNDIFAKMPSIRADSRIFVKVFTAGNTLIQSQLIERIFAQLTNYSV